MAAHTDCQDNFIFKSPPTPLDTTSFVDRLTAKMANLVYNPPTQCKKKTIYVSKLFETCTHVFVRDIPYNHLTEDLLRP